MQNAIRQKIQLSLTFWVACIPVLIVDQASKWWVLNRIPVQPEGMGLRLDEPFAFTVVPRLLAFIHTRNEGAAFSIFQTMPALLTLIAAGLAVAVLVWALFFLPAPERLSRISLGLIFGGAVGNLVDRVLHDLHVVDFILVLIQYKGRLWPTFNVADMAICVGIGLFLIASLRTSSREAGAEMSRVLEEDEERKKREERGGRAQRKPSHVASGTRPESVE